MSPALHALVQPGAAGEPVLLLLHGVGSDEADLQPLGRELLDRGSVVSLRAPFPGAPWGYGPGHAWYRFRPDMQPVAETFAAGAAALDAFVGELPTRLGTTPGPLIIGGFSQGGAMALDYALRHRTAVHGVMLWSGYLVDGGVLSRGEAPPAGLRVFWGHGSADPIVPFDWASRGWAALRAAGVALDAHRYDGMPHTIWPAEIADSRRWLAALA